jgi:hypothetical protein
MYYVSALLACALVACGSSSSSSAVDVCRKEVMGGVACAGDADCYTWCAEGGRCAVPYADPVPYVWACLVDEMNPLETRQWPMDVHEFRARFWETEPFGCAGPTAARVDAEACLTDEWAPSSSSKVADGNCIAWVHNPQYCTEKLSGSVDPEDERVCHLPPMSHGWHPPVCVDLTVQLQHLCMYEWRDGVCVIPNAWNDMCMHTYVPGRLCGNSGAVSSSCSGFCPRRRPRVANSVLCYNAQQKPAECASAGGAWSARWNWCAYDDLRTAQTCEHTFAACELERPPQRP